MLNYQKKSKNVIWRQIVFFVLLMYDINLKVVVKKFDAVVQKKI